jgi:branched-chain amino acid transport system permease protein
MTDLREPQVATAAVGPFKVVRGSTTSRIFGVVAILFVGFLAFMPSWGDAAFQRKMVELLTLLAMAQMWNLLAGFAGVVSVGQQAFVGIGAYSMVALVNVHGQNLYWSVPLSALIAGLISIPLGFVAFRLRGSYFAIGTWVLAEMISLIVIQQTSLGAGNGVSLKVAGYDLATRQDVTYWLALVAGVGSVLLAYLVLRSRLGLQMQAIRDNEAGARGLGANVYRTRFVIWVIAAFWTGFAGSVFYLSTLRVQPREAFSVIQWIAPIIFIVVIGGIGRSRDRSSARSSTTSFVTTSTTTRRRTSSGPESRRSSSRCGSSPASGVTSVAGWAPISSRSGDA